MRLLHNLFKVVALVFTKPLWHLSLSAPVFSPYKFHFQEGVGLMKIALQSLRSLAETLVAWAAVLWIMFSRIWELRRENQGWSVDWEHSFRGMVKVYCHQLFEECCYPGDGALSGVVVTLVCLCQSLSLTHRKKNQEREGTGEDWVK